MNERKEKLENEGKLGNMRKLGIASKVK